VDSFLYSLHVSLILLYNCFTTQLTVEEKPMKLRVGDQAPDLVLQSHLDQEIHLASLQGKNIVLAFFPLAWTPI
jgi:peroxiredoxin